MTPLVLAVLSFLVPAGFFALVFVAGIVGRRFADDEFSLPRYAAFVAVALGLAVLLVAAKTTWVFLVVAGVLVLWVLLRGAIDAQVTGIREKLGFLQLYAALLVALYSALVRTDTLAAARVTPTFRALLDDALSELLVPVGVLARGTRASAYAELLARSLSTTLADHLVLVLALATFALAAFVYAHLAEHATPKVGLSLLPAPTAVGVSWLALLLVGRVTNAPLGTIAAVAATALMPYLVAEGLWVVHRFAARLRIRGVLVGFLAMLAVVSVGLCHALAVTGLGFHLVRFRAFEPILGDVDRSASRPRLRTPIFVALASSLVYAVLGLAASAAVSRVSPGRLVGAEACNGVTLTASPAGVVVAGPSASFTIDADETPVSSASAEEMARVCSARGARLCTSDEWTLACVCSYPNESVGGQKFGENDRLVYRIETEKRDGTPVDVQHLLSGRTELVAPGLGRAALLAGPTDAVEDAWMVDCRARMILSDAARASGASLVAVRCCR